jgi:hypothetical protein
MRHYNEFLNVNSCLLLDRTSDIKGLRMTNLEYLLSKMKVDENADLAAQQEAQLLSYKFSRLIELVFHVTNGLKCSQCGKIISYEEYIQQLTQVSSDAENPQGVKCQCGSIDWQPVVRYDKETTQNNKIKPVLIIDDHRITSDDFDLFRQVVMYQNLPDYFDDSWIDPDLRADHAAKMELQHKKNPVSTTTELKMLAVVASTGYKLEEIYEMPIRKFISLLNLIDDKITYTTTRIGLMSGMVSLKEPLEHWLYKKESDVYGDAYKSVDQVESTVGQLGS